LVGDWDLPLKFITWPVNALNLIARSSGWRRVCSPEGKQWVWLLESILQAVMLNLITLVLRYPGSNFQMKILPL